MNYPFFSNNENINYDRDWFLGKCREQHVLKAFHEKTRIYERRRYLFLVICPIVLVTLFLTVVITYSLFLTISLIAFYMTLPIGWNSLVISDIISEIVWGWIGVGICIYVISTAIRSITNKRYKFLFRRYHRWLLPIYIICTLYLGKRIIYTTLYSVAWALGWFGPDWEIVYTALVSGNGNIVLAIIFFLFIYLPIYLIIRIGWFRKTSKIILIFGPHHRYQHYVEKYEKLPLEKEEQQRIIRIANSLMKSNPFVKKE